MQSFILPANGKATPDSIARKRRMAEAMMAEGMQTSPIASPWQGAARMANALVGGLASSKADQQDAALQEETKKEAMARQLLLDNRYNSETQYQHALNNRPQTSVQGGQIINVDPNTGTGQASPIPGYQAPAPEDYTLAPDARRFAGGSNQQIAQGAPKTPDSVINNNVDMKGESAYSVDRNKAFAKRADDIDTAEQSAFKTLNSLNQMENLIADPSFYSGFGADQLQALKSMTVSMGGDPNQVNSMEQFNTLSKNAALDTMGGSLGTGFSNADRDFVVGQVPNLQNTPAGNKAVIAINRKMQERKIQIAKMAREYEVKTGRLDAGFMQQLSSWAEQNQLFANMPQAAPQQNAPFVGGNSPAPKELNWTPDKGLH